VAEVNEVSISRSGLDRSEIRETIAAIEAEKKIEYMQIYNEVVQEEEERIANPKSTQSKFVNFALKFQGTPYWYGGSTPNAFDCSGFVAYVIKKVLKKNVRHSATSQMQLGRRVRSPLPGDLVGFGYGNHFGHIGIYVGNGKVIDALNPHRDIGVRSLDWMESNVGPIAFARIIEPNKKFNPHKITKQIINKKNELSFTP
jgi:cell wall-associated NlpC family hydrolase